VFSGCATTCPRLRLLVASAFHCLPTAVAIDPYAESSRSRDTCAVLSASRLGSSSGAPSLPAPRSEGAKTRASRAVDG
jgi:hypothetical protein